MKLQILDSGNKKVGDIDMPKLFNEPVRADIIHRAVLAEQVKRRQPYGSDPEAGKKYSAELSRRRRAYRGSYGKGISRVPRKIMSRSGTQFNWAGATMPGTVGGRRAHPPKPSKKWDLKVNKKEFNKALRSAMAATLDKNSVSARNHNMPENYPFILDSKIEDTQKTKNLVEALKALGFEKEMDRTNETKTRAGKGKLRGRRKITKTGLLVVVGKICPLSIAINNIPGFNAKLVDQLEVEDLAPGTTPGRLTLFTQNAIDRLNKEELYK